MCETVRTNDAVKFENTCKQILPRQFHRQTSSSVYIHVIKWQVLYNTQTQYIYKF